MARIYLTQPPLQRDFDLRSGETARGFNAVLNSGDDMVLRFTNRNAAGTAVTIAAWTGITLNLYTQAGVLALTETGALVGGGTGGQFDVTLTPANTDTLAGTYIAELQVTGTGIKLTPLRGTVQILETYIPT